MASKKKSTAPKTIVEKEPVVIEEKDILTEEEVEKVQPEEVIDIKAPIVEVKEVKKEKKQPKKEEKVEKKPKYSVGSIVYISKDADADLNGFKLFPQYKKYTYTVEAYDEISGVYSLRRLNLSLRLKEDLILAPSERAHDSLNRRQF